MTGDLRAGPRAGLAAAGGCSVEGPRPPDGSLALKIGTAGRRRRSCRATPGRFPRAAGGLRGLRFPIRSIGTAAGRAASPVSAAPEARASGSPRRRLPPEQRSREAT